MVNNSTGVLKVLTLLKLGKLWYVSLTSLKLSKEFPKLYCQTNHQQRKGVLLEFVFLWSTPWAKQLEEERLHFRLQLSGHTPSLGQLGAPGRILRQDWSRSQEVVKPTDLLPWASQLAIFYAEGPPVQGWYHPQLAEPFLSKHPSGKCPTGFPKGHS